MAVIKKQPIDTTTNILSAGDGVYEEQINYGASIGGIISATDVIVRHFEDYNEKFIPNRIYNAQLSNPSGLTVRLAGGASVYATIRGRWIKISSDTDVTVAANDTSFVYLTVGTDGGTEDTRLGTGDTVTLTSVVDGTGYTDTQNNLLLAKVVAGASTITTLTSFYSNYGNAHIRASAIKPVSSKVTMFGGVFTDQAPVAEYSANYLTFFDDAYLSFGTGKDSKITYVSADDKLLWDLPSGDLEISGGTITGVPNPTADSEVANKSYVDNFTRNFGLAADSGTSDGLNVDSEDLTISGGIGINTSVASETFTIDVDLTTSEFSQLQNIGSSTISSTQWGYVGNLNQNLTTASSVTFNSISASSTEFVSVIPISGDTGTHGNTGDIGDVNLAYDDDSQEYIYTDDGSNNPYTVVSGRANTITVLKDNISVYVTVSVQLLDGQTIRTANVDVTLEANNGSGWSEVDSHTFSGLTGNSTTTLVWTIPSGSKYYSDDFGDSLQLRAGARFTPSGNVSSGTGVLTGFNITNGSDWARFPRILSANAGSTLNGFV